MDEVATVGFFGRLGMALSLPFRLLFDGAAAGRVRAALAGRPALPEVEAEPPREAGERDLSPALQVLAILQREGRLLDFLAEDVAGFSDADVGAAARVVHAGCRKVLQDYVVVEPLRREAEGTEIVVEPGYDPRALTVTGNLAGEPPWRGRLVHHGWRAAKASLPEPAADADPTILAPAEVEL